ncbi:hypothetical protein DdX_15384 [Ditylenchus destructor]|uniref:Uncharacterized protein n=1 Tax=Ditylenchus destructor TaxID=166010 RepID=A0AAD4MSU7_9BILA|nr:hypothetical protein DdX_15384 [Ditylenchus destructor]
MMPYFKSNLKIRDFRTLLSRISIHLFSESALVNRIKITVKQLLGNHANFSQYTEESRYSSTSRLLFPSTTQEIFLLKNPTKKVMSRGDRMPPELISLEIKVDSTQISRTLIFAVTQRSIISHMRKGNN